MTTLTTTTPRADAGPAPTRHRFTVDDYYRMAAAGVLHEDSRVELIEGEVIAMSPIGTRHAGTVNRLNHLFSQRLGERAVVQVQCPVLLDGHSEPEPDIALLKPRDDFYDAAKPTAADVLLLIEVADSSLAYDQATKLPLYAKHGVPEVWIVDLSANRVETHRDPSGDGYGAKQTFRGKDEVACRAFPEVAASADTILNR